MRYLTFLFLAFVFFNANAADGQQSYSDRISADESRYLSVYIFNKYIPISHEYVLIAAQAKYHRFHRKSNDTEMLPETVSLGPYDSDQYLKSQIYSDEFMVTENIKKCGFVYDHAISIKTIKTAYDEKHMHSFSVYNAEEFFDVLTFYPNKWKKYFKKYFLTCSE